MVVCNRPSLIRTLRTTGFDRIVSMTETVDDAKKAFTNAGAEGDIAKS